MRTRMFLLRAVLLAGIAVGLIWPALWNRGPFYSGDTRTYVRSADTAVNKLTHWRTGWTAPEENTAAPRYDLPQNSDLALHNLAESRTRSLAEIGKKGILLGRSPFYGLLLYLGAVTGGFWLSILLQAGAVLLAVYLSLRALRRPAWPSLAWVGLALCLVPAAPFFSSYLMPDIFAGIAILACVVLLSTCDRLPRKDYLLWYLLLSASMLFHDSTAMIAACLLGLGILVNLANLLRRSRPLRPSWLNWRGLAVILLAGITTWAGQSLVAYGARKVTGKPALHLPFLSARLVADGPGTAYLRATCPASHFALCDYAAEFPITDPEFLFSAQPGRSVFEMAPYEERRALSEEQVRFFLAVLKFDPAGVLRSSLRNAALQLIDFRLNTFDYNPGGKDVLDRTLPLSALAQVQRSAAYRGTMPTAAPTVLLYVAVIASLTWFLILVAGGWRKGAESPELKRVFLWTLAGVVINAGICGALSAVDPRYGARVIWLIPLAALLVESQRWIRGKRSA